MMKLLTTLIKSPLGQYFGFRGGTLAYFHYGLPRFSVDLDFDLIKDTSHIDIMHEIKSIIQDIGTVKDIYDKKNTYFFLIDYGKNHQKIKIEISKRAILKEEYELSSLFGLSLFTMKKDALLSNKSLALVKRSKIASRDLFDIHYFLSQGWQFNNQVIKERTGMSTHDRLIHCKKYIKKSFNQTNLLAGLGELVNNKQKYFIKHELINETIGLLDLYLLGSN